MPRPKLRERLGESLASVQKFDASLAEATTSSLDALKAFSLGEKEIGESSQSPSGMTAGVAHLEQAIQLDPSFALAYRSLGNAYINLYGPSRGAMYAAKAYELRDHASERERLQIAAGYYANVLGDLPKAIGSLHTAGYELSSRREVFAIHWGPSTRSVGQYEQAAELIRFAINQRPDLNIYFGNLANYLMAQQRLDEARDTIAQAHAHKLDDFVLRLALYGLDFLKADEAGMNAQLQWLANRPEAASFSFSSCLRYGCLPWTAATGTGADDPWRGRVAPSRQQGICGYRHGIGSHPGGWLWQSCTRTAGCGGGAEIRPRRVRLFAPWLALRWP